MKPVLLSLLLLMASRHASAQMDFAVVADKDGYVNVRQRPGADKPVKDKLYNGDVVFVMGGEGNSDWWEIDYSRKKDDNGNGYVHKSRLKMIAGMPAGKATYKSLDSLVLQLGNIKVVIVRIPFVAARHKLHYSNQRQLDRIDGLDFWGTDGGLPQTAYKAITIITGKKEYKLPAAALQSLFNPSLHMVAIHEDAAAERLYVSSYNSDGAGGYTVLWCIEHGKYLFRRAFYGF
ncbi:SH3 domain-containing protein [Chitinophaga sp. Cy-1792]|uniref:SH3 domain-containing protein n=1 Tax=Chitinophaga sp. Cy-1792 TaxID=2608339 RepID=UPI001421AE5B|nr:SH3 domain-containing protein [Chitinophaga sp. Cy-1792]NIG55479.1 SH3 domain-containing protein [Chitinophaga sp. Cy-1792]